MAGSKVYGGASNMSVLLQNERLPCSSEVLEPLWIPSSEPSFHGNFLNFWCSFCLWLLGHLSYYQLLCFVFVAYFLFEF